MFTLYLLTVEQEFGAGTSLQSSCKHHSWNFQEIASKLHGTMPKECIPDIDWHQARLREEERAADVRKREMEAACQD